jgi:hypothetical protein
VRWPEGLGDVFPDFTLEVFAERHHFDAPHRSEPRRLAESLRAIWARGNQLASADSGVTTLPARPQDGFLSTPAVLVMCLAPASHEDRPQHFPGTSKIEVIAGRVDCDGRMGGDLPVLRIGEAYADADRRSPLWQEGWRSSYEIDVVNDGAKGMRSLVTTWRRKSPRRCSTGSTWP